MSEQPTAFTGLVRKKKQKMLKFMWSSSSFWFWRLCGQHGSCLKLHQRILCYCQLRFVSLSEIDRMLPMSKMRNRTLVLLDYWTELIIWRQTVTSRSHFTLTHSISCLFLLGICSWSFYAATIKRLVNNNENKGPADAFPQLSHSSRWQDYQGRLVDTRW